MVLSHFDYINSLLSDCSISNLAKLSILLLVYNLDFKLYNYYKDNGICPMGNAVVAMMSQQQ